MHIGHFLLTGNVNHFFVKPGNFDPIEQILAYRRMYKSEPQRFKKAIASILENPGNDPGNRRIFIELLPLVIGPSLASGMKIYTGHQRETTSHRNYLQLRETTCNGVGNWWAGIPETDLRF